MDFDGDGLLNEIERQLGTYVDVRDSDGDGLEDLFEYENGLDPTDGDDLYSDLDGDYIPAITEVDLGLDPSKTDTHPIEGLVRFDVWDHPVYAINNLTQYSGFPQSPDVQTVSTSVSFAPSDEDLAGGGSSRIRGLIEAPETGDYSFWVAGSNQVQFWLSTDDTPYAMSLSASVMTGRTGKREFDKYAEQQSNPIRLVAGQRYYFEVLQASRGGEAHFTMAWQYGSEPRRDVASEFILSAADREDDLNSNGLLDSWEAEFADQVVMPGYWSDVDGDGLTDGLEFQANTWPNRVDSDFDGASDFEEYYDDSKDPLFPDATEWTAAQQFDVRGGAAVVGRWFTTKGGEKRGTSAGTSRIGWDVIVDTPGVYTLEIDLKRVKDTPYSQGKEIDIELSWNDAWLGRQLLSSESASSDGVITATLGLPYVVEGANAIELSWFNVFEGSSISIPEIRLMSPVGIPEGDLVAWQTNYLKANNSVSVSSVQSITSPAYLSGVSSFPKSTEVDGQAPYISGPKSWYQYVDLDPTGAEEPIAVEFHGGRLSEDVTVQWIPIRVFDQLETIVLVSGDSLLIDGRVAASAEGQFSLFMDDALVSSANTVPTPVLFDASGLKTVRVEFVDTDGVVHISSVDVDVISIPDTMPESIAGWHNRTQRVGFELVDESFNIEGDGVRTAYVSRTNDGVSSYSIAVDDWNPLSSVNLTSTRLPGRVLKTIPVSTFSFWATVNNFLQAEVIEEGLHLVSNNVFASGLPAGADMEISVFKAGVTLEDGLRSRIVTAGEFSETGTYSYGMIKPTSVRGGACHRIYVNFNGQRVGQR